MYWICFQLYKHWFQFIIQLMCLYLPLANNKIAFLHHENYVLYYIRQYIQYIAQESQKPLNHCLFYVICCCYNLNCFTGAIQWNYIIYKSRNHNFCVHILKPDACTYWMVGTMVNALMCGFIYLFFSWIEFPIIELSLSFLFVCPNQNNFDFIIDMNIYFRIVSMRRRKYVCIEIDR